MTREQKERKQKEEENKARVGKNTNGRMPEQKDKQKRKTNKFRDEKKFIYLSFLSRAQLSQVCRTVQC